MQDKILKNLKAEELVLNLKQLVKTERKITADILTYIAEVNRRQIYLNDYSSLLSFLVEEIGYTKTAALRRMDAAKLLSELPEIKLDIESGSINLSQVSMLAQCVRQKQKESPELKIETEDKRELLDLVRDQDLESSQKILAQTLELEVKAFEKLRIQKDESVRRELTFSKEEDAIIKRAKELLSHSHPAATMAEAIVLFAAEYIKRKDPSMARRKYSKSSKAVLTPPPELSPLPEISPTSVSPKVRSATDLSVSNVPSASGKNHSPINIGRTYVPAAIRREVFQRDKCCQWKNRDGQICGSQFQAELDHIQPVWDGGSNEIENLQRLCRPHNMLKYRTEAGIRRA